MFNVSGWQCEKLAVMLCNINEIKVKTQD